MHTEVQKWQLLMQITAWKTQLSLGMSAGCDGTYLPGPRQTDLVTGKPTFHRHHEATNRHGETHTWLGSNQPQASVLTPSDVPPPLHFSYPVYVSFLLSSMFELSSPVGGCPSPWSVTDSHGVILRGYSLSLVPTHVSIKKEQKKTTRFSWSFPTLPILLS